MRVALWSLLVHLLCLGELFAAGNEIPNPASTLPDGGATERKIKFFRERVGRDPDDTLAQNRLAEFSLQRLRETGDYKWLEEARAAAKQSLIAVPAARNVGGLIAMIRVEQESHHFAAAREFAQQLTRLDPNKSFSFALLGDAELELGDLEQAGESYALMLQRGGDAYETRSRLARLALARGSLEGARRYFEEAREGTREYSAEHPETTAWCLVRLGQLAFNTGDWAAAEKHYQAALELLPNDASAREHLGELRAAQERYPEAVELYQKVVAKVLRPEFFQALGDVYAAAGNLEEAKAWHERARAGYLKNVQLGNEHYYHHLAGFFSDTEEDAPEALKWARKDLELRHSAAARDSLAWALYRNGKFAEAAQAASAALATGTKDAHVLFHAGMIFLAAKDEARGKEILAETARINPKQNAFHVHR